MNNLLGNSQKQERCLTHRAPKLPGPCPTQKPETLVGDHSSGPYLHVEGFVCVPYMALLDAEVSRKSAKELNWYF